MHDFHASIQEYLPDANVGPIRSPRGRMKEERKMKRGEDGGRLEMKGGRGEDEERGMKEGHEVMNM